MAKAKAVATVEEKLPAVGYDYGDYLGAGYEETNRDDFLMPMLYVLQPTSPICAKNDDARPGMLLNTSNEALYPADKGKGHKGITFVPCYPQHQFVEWKPDRGGFVASHAPDSKLVQDMKAKGEFGKMVLPNGNELVDTFYLYGLIVPEDEREEPEMMVVPFSSTKIKPYKKLMTRLSSIRVGGRPVPLFAHRVRMQTVFESRDAGDSYNFELSLDGASREEAAIDPTSPLFKAAAEFWDNCRSGLAKPNYESAAAQGEAKVDAPTSDIPF